MRPAIVRMESSHQSAGTAEAKITQRAIVRIEHSDRHMGGGKSSLTRRRSRPASLAAERQAVRRENRGSCESECQQ